MVLTVAVLSNAGGAGKSTLCVNLAYALAQKKIDQRMLSVALFDLDPAGTLNLFCGIMTRTKEESLSKVLAIDFEGNYPFKPCWQDYKVKVDLCQSEQESLKALYDSLSSHPRGAYRLADALKDYPIPHDVLLLDCPGTIGKASDIALSAADCIAIVLEPEPKNILAVSNLITHYLSQCKQMRLEPYPPILGLIISKYRKDQSAHRETVRNFPSALTARGFNYKIYPPIRFSYEFTNSSGSGLPLFAYRPGHAASKDFGVIVEDIFNLIKIKEGIHG